MDNSLQKAYQYANRKEVELQLYVKEGILPDDIFGVIYLTSMVGSLNSGGLPIPERHPGDSYDNPEFGTPQLAGDGMMFKIDFNKKNEVHLKTLISKPPCYFADLATSRNNSPKIEEKFRDYGFKSAGMSRASFQLGFRNQLNVAVIPMQFENDKHPRMIVTFDAGRPWEFNTETLEMITPIQRDSEWIKGTPPGLKFPFYMVQTSAHPSFDPITKELFNVNYSQKKSAGYQVAFLLLLLEHRDEIREELEVKARLLDKIRDKIDHAKMIKDVVKDLRYLFDKSQNHPRFSKQVTNALKKYGLTAKDLEDTLSGLSSEDQVFLMKWNGKQEPLKKWRVTDENGNDIEIDECMHQTAVTEDYILLADSSFKFSADLLVNNPFPDVPIIDKMLRLLLNKKMPIDMRLYIIKRSDLTNEATTVKAKLVSLPEDCIHFSANYKNPGGSITLYTINNNSLCVAEWIRPYDNIKISGKPVYKELIGIPSMSAMDLNSITKYVVNANNGTVHRLDCAQTGGPVGNVTKPHTWEVALFTYRDMIAPNKVVDEIKNLFVFSVGLNSETLTTYMYDLYKNTPNKIVPTDKVLEYTKAGVTQCLFRLNTDQMDIMDHYMAEFNTELRSIQFVPRKNARQGVEPSIDGYIVCIAMIGESKKPNASLDMNYDREIWIFEADNLKKGPICKLVHPEMSYSFTLHSAWIEEAVQQETNYHISVRDDYANPQSVLPGVQKNIKEFFEKYVYPNFDPKPPMNA